MAYWSRGGLSGFDSTPVEIAGEVVTIAKGYLIFNDGISTRHLPLEYVTWHPQRKTVTIPQWLEKRTRKPGKWFGIAVKKSIRFRKWASGGKR